MQLFMNFRLSLYFFLTILFFSCKTANFQAYFPLNKNQTILFTKHIDSTDQTIIDTIICRESVAKTMIKSTKRRILLSDVLRDNYIINGKLNLYYFEKTAIDSNSKIWMHDNSFAQRLYSFKSGNLYVGYGWTKNMQYDTELDFLFPKRLKLNFDYHHRNGDYWKTFRYIKKETIKIDKKTYKNCLKMDIYETLGESKKTATIWFARKVGIIKWIVKNEKVDFIHL